VLVLYTDGITEARNKNDQMFTLARLQESLSRHASLADASAVNHGIMEDIFTFINDAEQYDDITLLVLSVH
jgi:sigma-B regulation protein RsbU (phosphoserine phosphatase)